jgi:NTE family protein
LNPIDPPQEQRALVLQGGGALGAYEAGVYKALYNSFVKPYNQPFDIFAGVSIGAVNASILVSHALQNNNRWDDSVENLYNFWNDISRPKISDLLSWPLYWLDNNPALAGWWIYQGFVRNATIEYYKIFKEFIKTIWKPDWPFVPVWIEESPYFTLVSWKENWREQLPHILGYFMWPDNLGPVALHEAARRYYSWRYFLQTGISNVITPSIPQLDFKFFDLFNTASILYRFDNEPLKRTISKYWSPDAPPISTGEESESKQQTRLLLVSVDLQNCATATFDSYKKEKDVDGKPIHRTVYGEDKIKYTIDYPRGVGMEHLMTSMSSHLKYKYPELSARSEENGSNSTNNGQPEPRHFWDGIYLSNTPLRELLQAHRDYWFGVRGMKDNIPKLKVYIIDLYPTVEKGIPEGFDEINDRQYDVLFHDRTRYDEKVAHIISDYINMSKQLVNAINTVSNPSEKKKLQQELKRILGTTAKSTSRGGKERHYGDLLEGHFDVEVFRIERSEDDETDIFGKAFDFSYRTIDQLRQQGEQDALRQIEEERIKW